MSFGVTEDQKRVYDAIIAFVGLHGAVPPLLALAHDLGMSPANLHQLLTQLHDRGHITRSTRGMILIGSGGVSVIVPAELAAKLAVFCRSKEESISAVVADAIALHLDALAGADVSVEVS